MKNAGWLFLAILIAYGCAMVAPLLRYRLRGRVGGFRRLVPRADHPGLPLAHPVRECRAAGRVRLRIGRHHLQDGRVLPPLGQGGAEQRPSRVLPLLDPVPGTLRRLSRSQAAVAASGEPLAAGPASRRRDRRCHHGPPGDRSSIPDCPGPIELRAEPCRDVADLRAGHRIALAGALRARTPGGIRHHSDHPKRLPVADRLRVLATVQRPDPRLVLPQRLPGDRRPTRSGPRPCCWCSWSAASSTR